MRDSYLGKYYIATNNVEDSLVAIVIQTIWNQTLLKSSVSGSKERDERLVFGEVRNELTSFCQLEILELECRCTGTSDKSVVALIISGDSFSSQTIWRNAYILGRKGPKPDIRGHRVLGLLILQQIWTKTS